MMFNDTTNYNGLIQSCEFWTGLGRSQISGNTDRLKDFTRLINVNYHKVVTAVLNSMDGWDFDDHNHADTGFIKTYNITADTQTVTLPASDKILKIKRAEITYDGTEWYKMEPLDINEIGFGTSKTANIANNFSEAKPYYDMQGNYLYMYPIPDTSVTAGLKLWVAREVDEFTTADTTQEPGIDEPFHEMIAIGASADYAAAKSLGNAANLATRFNEYESRLRQYYGKKQDDGNLVLKAAYVDYN